MEKNATPANKQERMMRKCYSLVNKQQMIKIFCFCKSAGEDESKNLSCKRADLKMLLMPAEYVEKCYSCRQVGKGDYTIFLIMYSCLQEDTRYQ